MKKTNVRFSQEQPEILTTRILSEQQQQAKTGVITAPSGADPVIKALGDAAPVTSTLAGVARDALSAATLKKKVIINLANRTVTVLPNTADIDGIGAVAGIDPVSTITKDDPTKASSPMTASDDDGGTLSVRIAAITEEVKPALSVESLVNKIEDAFADQTGVFEGKSGLVVIDQDSEAVAVFKGDIADVEAYNPAAVFAEDAHFVQTLTLPSGSQFGE